MHLVRKRRAGWERKAKAADSPPVPGMPAPVSSREVLRELEREDRDSRAQEFPQLGSTCTHWASQPGVSLSPGPLCSSLRSHSPSQPNKNHQLCCHFLLQAPAADQLLPTNTRHWQPRVPAALQGRVWGMSASAGMAAGIVVQTGALFIHPFLCGAKEQLPGPGQTEPSASHPDLQRAAWPWEELSVPEQEGSGPLSAQVKGESGGWQGSVKEEIHGLAEARSLL